MIISITKECSTFLTESKQQPLLKNLPTKSEGFCRVKVRKQKIKSNIDEVFNKTFTEQHQALKQRCIVGYTESSLPKPEAGFETFYVFPIDGYEYMYSETVKDSQELYSNVYNQIKKQVGQSGSENILSELLEHNYVNKDLDNALKNDCEVIIYGIPYYYAIRKTLVEDYESLIYK